MQVGYQTVVPSLARLLLPHNPLRALDENQDQINSNNLIEGGEARAEGREEVATLTRAISVVLAIHIMRLKVHISGAMRRRKNVQWLVKERCGHR